MHIHTIHIILILTNSDTHIHIPNVHIDFQQCSSSLGYPLLYILIQYYYAMHLEGLNYYVYYIYFYIAISNCQVVFYYSTVRNHGMT